MVNSAAKILQGTVNLTSMSLSRFRFWQSPAIPLLRDLNAEAETPQTKSTAPEPAPPAIDFFTIIIVFFHLAEICRSRHDFVIITEHGNETNIGNTSPRLIHNDNRAPGWVETRDERVLWCGHNIFLRIGISISWLCGGLPWAQMRGGEAMTSCRW